MAPFVMSLSVQFEKEGRGFLREACWGEGECPPGLKAGVRRRIMVLENGGENVSTVSTQRGDYGGDGNCS